MENSLCVLSLGLGQKCQEPGEELASRVEHDETCFFFVSVALAVVYLLNGKDPAVQPSQETMHCMSPCVFDTVTWMNSMIHLHKTFL